MLSQVKKNKKAVSIMIGYVLLVSIAIIMSVVVYQWMKSYVPSENIECSDEVSLFIEDYTCEGDILNLTLKNNGKFNVAGYFIRATNDSEVKLATIDLSLKLINEVTKYESAVLFEGPINSLEPNEQGEAHAFDISEYSNLYSLEIIPVRFEEVEGRTKFVNCGNARIKEVIVC